MDLNLANKVYIVTGGAKGIGAAISKTIAAEGGIAVIAGRNKTDNQAIVDEIVKSGGKASYVTAELGTPETCSDVIDFAVEKYGRIDGLINNAGINDGVGLENGSPEKFFQSLKKTLVIIILWRISPCLISTSQKVISLILVLK